jgi:hypothetical protein
MAVDETTDRPFGDHGTAEQAIDFMLDVHEPDCGNQIEFLRNWREGNLSEWPEFYAWLSKKENKN